MEQAEKTAVERELNYLMEVTLKMEAELVAVVNRQQLWKEKVIIRRQCGVCKRYLFKLSFYKQFMKKMGLKISLRLLEYHYGC